MASTILVIDSNAAVQAITALALSETGCTIEQLSEGAHALDRIAKLRPTVVLIAKELTGVDPLQVPKRMAQIVPETRYVLLAPADGAATLELHATAAGFAAVLFKPFKSNRLREVVTKLLDRIPPVESLSLMSSSPPTIYLNLDDKFLTSLFQRLFSRAAADVVFDGTPSSHAPYATTISMWRQGAPAIQYPSDLYGKHILICLSDEEPAARLAYPLAQILPLPFGFAEVRDLLRGTIEFTSPPAAPEAPQTETTAPYAQPIALLAARISAAIYESLLVHPALREKNWEQAAELVREEALRIVGSSEDQNA